MMLVEVTRAVRDSVLEALPEMLTKALDERMDVIVAKTAMLVPAGRDGQPGTPGRPGTPGEDGKDGRDGKDGFGIDDFELAWSEDGRSLGIAMRGNDRVITREIDVEGMPIDRGVFRAGQPYKKGDGVTYGGCYWFATKNNPTGEPPKGPNDCWRMAVKGFR